MDASSGFQATSGFTPDRVDGPDYYQTNSFSRFIYKRHRLIY